MRARVPSVRFKPDPIQAINMSVERSVEDVEIVLRMLREC